MYRIMAEQLVRIGSAIERYAGNTSVDTSPMELVCETDRGAFKDAFKAILSHCQYLKLEKTTTVIEAALEDYGLLLGQTVSHLKHAVKNIEAVFIKELSDQIIVAITPGRAQYMKTIEESATHPPFGNEVASSFSSANDDAYEAAICYATYRSTACVFHSMRVAEKGLIAVAKALNVPFSIPFEYENWLNIINPIEKAIRDLEQNLSKGPVKAETLKFYSQAATQFFYWKNAWRNHVSHAREDYDEDQSEVIFKHVGDFMQYLAEGGLHD
jgi:hypothetical protein